MKAIDMQTSILSHHATPLALVGLLTLLSQTALLPLNAQDKPTANAAPSPFAKNLIGTWTLAGTPTEPNAIPAAGGRFKFFTGHHWCITQAAPQTGQTIFHHGGTYQLNGDEYVETVEYANASTTNLIGRTFKFTCKIEGNTLTQSGIGNPWKEVWKRAN